MVASQTERLDGQNRTVLVKELLLKLEEERESQTSAAMFVTLYKVWI